MGQYVKKKMLAFSLAWKAVQIMCHRTERKGLGSGLVFCTCTGRNKTLPPSTSLPVVGEPAGINMASLGGCLHGSKTRARWAEGFHDEVNSHMFDVDSGGLRQVVPCPWVTMRWKVKSSVVPLWALWLSDRWRMGEGEGHKVCVFQSHTDD